MPKKLITVSREIMGGTPVFSGTRVPVEFLFEHIEAGETLDEFLEGYPTVTREHAIAVLEAAKAKLLTHAA
jgi:uncharacterized protein (DUF433 family)